MDDDERHESGVYVLPNYATQLYQVRGRVHGVFTAMDDTIVAAELL